MVQFSFVTTCKGRLAELRQVLPAMARQPDSELIVVDYGCPDKVGDYVAATYPAAKIVRTGETPGFNISRARNLGAAQAQGDWIVFIDSDILIDEQFIAKARPHCVADGFLTFKEEKLELAGISGTCLVPRSAWQKVLGYDEVIEGYGAEDKDFYFRLARAGLARRFLGEELIAQVLTNSTEQRVQFYEFKDMSVNLALNSAYRQLKWQLLILSNKVEFPQQERTVIREKIMESYQQMRAKSQTRMSVLVRLPHDGTVVRSDHFQVARVAGVEVAFRA